MQATVTEGTAASARDRFLEALRGMDWLRAVHFAREVLRSGKTARDCTFIANQLKKSTWNGSAKVVIKLALLSSFTTEFVHNALIAYGFANNIDIHIYQPGFAQFRQEICDPHSQLYRFRPD